MSERRRELRGGAAMIVLWFCVMLAALYGLPAAGVSKVGSAVIATVVLLVSFAFYGRRIRRRS